MHQSPVVVHWFRRDLRLSDNPALSAASQSPFPTLPLFIFDREILDPLERDDARVSFIHESLQQINLDLQQHQASLLVKNGEPLQVWKELVLEFNIQGVYLNRDYEPYALNRDSAIGEFLKQHGIPVYSFQDQVIFEPNEILKADGKPYTIYTPYKKKWLERFDTSRLNAFPVNKKGFLTTNFPFPAIQSIGFQKSKIKVKPIQWNQLHQYGEWRDFPAKAVGSNLGPHLRFGTISTREAVQRATETNEVFLSELIWREFFMQILFHFPSVIDHSFHAKYDRIAWRNNPEEFERWCEGKTGFPMVDAGMRELKATGTMHNRVRMVTASFLTKHLLIDWRLGEAWFAKHLLDYELASNNGNWQWAAGTGCDAAPYFRIFNPIEQFKKFDPQAMYVRKWVPEWDHFDYVPPMVDHKMARERALKTYKEGIM